MPQWTKMSLLIMDNKPVTNLKYHINQLVNRNIPYLVILIGILLSIISCYNLLVKNPSDQFFYTLLPENQPWIILIIGTLFSLLCGATLRLIQLTYEHKRALKQIKHDFNLEISKHLQAEETKKKLEIALLEGQKLQAIGTLAGGIAHDFNNILYAINGYVEMAREDVDQKSQVFINLGRVLEASLRGQELVARILEFGRRNQRYERKPIHINTLIENVLALLRPTVPSSIRFNLIGTTENRMILGNQTQLHQVIINIINNAVDAMYSEGTITIHISTVLENDVYLKQFPEIVQGHYCRIDITDTGHGMDQTTLKRIFEPFYTTKEVGKGTGLGLASVHGIIAQHGGQVTVTSQLGQGATFTLLLPEYKETPTKMEETYGNYSFSGR
jgi:signal transduction histidine kinase